MDKLVVLNDIKDWINIKAKIRISVLFYFNSCYNTP